MKPTVAKFIAGARAAAGNAKEALTWAAGLTTPSVKAEALFGVAEGIVTRLDASEKDKDKPKAKAN